MNSNIYKKIENRIISKDTKLLSALKQMDKIDKKLLLVFDEDKFVNLLSIGDIQRAIINKLSLDTPILKILRSNTKNSSNTESVDLIKKRMFELRAECMPILNEEKDLVDVFFWEDIFEKDQKRKPEKINLPVVIMAGGRGSRLKPITNVIPKPLIPIGDKTIIEEIMDRFVEVGCNDFYLSVNYKAETIKHYFEQLQNNDYKIDYFQEEKPLGTAGSLFLIRDEIKTTFFVSNCDIIIDEDYEEILKYHRENKNELTIVSALKHYPIPYGTIETKNGGKLKLLKEKPELTFQINSGMYVLEPYLLDEIPENEFFHITQLIENIQKRNGRVGVFPISEGSWIDIGEWNQYFKISKIID